MNGNNGRRCGATMWLTGLPGAGKSTLANALAAELDESGRRVEILDGDELRANLSPELGFSAEDRDAHVRRVGFLARLLARNGVIVLVPVIAPYAHSRAAAREQHEADEVTFLEVHVATSLRECMRRDPKGLYAKAASGQLTGLTGLDDVYEAPRHPQLSIDTAEVDVDAARVRLHELLERCGVVGATQTSPVR